MSDRPRAIPRFVPSRRRFLAGAAAATLLAACGDDDNGPSGTVSGDGGSGTGRDGAGASDGAGGDELSVVRFFGPFFAAGELARVPFGIADTEGILPADDVPERLTVSVSDPDGNEVASGIESNVRVDGLPRPYYSFEFTPEAPGFFDFTATAEGVDIVSQFQVVGADDPSVAGRIGPGDAMPALATPTVADPKGVTPLCTREPMCDLHERTVAEVLGSGPMALLVATPAFCQTVVCGPVLDILLGLVPDHPEVSFVHAEVFTNPSENQVPPAPDDFAPVIAELGLPYEPVLFVVDADGTVVDRIDYIFDGADMRRSLDAVG